MRQTREQLAEKKRIYNANHAEEIKIKKKEHYLKNKKTILAKGKEYRLKNKDKIKLINQAYYQKNKEKILPKYRIYNKKYQILNRAKINEYRKKKKHKDEQYRLRTYLRTRIYQILKGQKSGGSAIKSLGCSIGELKIHLEKQFKPGMNWQNWGHTGWHIDHVTPLSSFDLTNSEDIKKACHYTNLKPLWWRENLSKGKKIPGPDALDL